jgi:hypothetical protein
VLRCNLYLFILQKTFFSNPASKSLAFIVGSFVQWLKNVLEKKSLSNAEHCQRNAIMPFSSKFVQPLFELHIYKKTQLNETLFNFYLLFELFSVDGHIRVHFIIIDIIPMLSHPTELTFSKLFSPLHRIRKP